MTKSKVLNGFLGLVVLAGLAYAGGVEVGRGTWYQHPVLYPAVQTIGAAGTIAADACGGIKRITATAARTTDTTDTFTAPASVKDGCQFDVVNVGSFTITLDANANFKTQQGFNVVLGSSDSVRVGQIGGFTSGDARYWVQLSSAVDTQ